MTVTFYFAWTEPGETFDPEVHNRFDEQVLGIDVTHDEGGLPSLSIALKNPRVGLLGTGRQTWCWLSVDMGSGPVPVFRGRLLAVPSDMHREAITLDFVARPPDYVEQREVLAASLRVLPWWDDLWVGEAVASPDTVLESRSALFHVDRTELVVSISDVLDGEDGTVEVSDHLYGSLQVGFGQQPLRRMDVTANLTWHQVASGDVDLTTTLWKSFRDVGSPFAWPQVGSFTSEGLFGDWPKIEDDLGGGWSVSGSATAEFASFAQGWKYPKTWVDQTDDTKDQLQAISISPDPVPLGNHPSYLVMSHGGWVTWTATFSVDPILQHFVASYTADRERTEQLTFSLEADVQPTMVDPEGSDVEVLEVSSSFVDKPVDPGGLLPIGDLRRNCYFPTDRGQMSLQHLILICRAKLRFRARAVIVTFQVEGWMLDLSCRMNVRLVDNRLPGGQVVGKVTSYKLTAKKTLVTEVTIGCAVGRGVVLPPAAMGDDVYADDYSVGYTVREGAEVTVLAGEVTYDPLDVAVVDDDGVDFFNMTPETVVTDAVVTNGPSVQQAGIDAEAARTGSVAPDPIEVLRNLPTGVSIGLVPVEGGSFFTVYEASVSQLVIPKMVDLEAPSV